MGLIRLVGNITELTIIVIIVGCSLAVIISMGLLKDDFDGLCPLYPTVYSNNVMKLNDPENCNFVIAWHCVALVIALVLAAYRIFELVKQRRIIKTELVPFVFMGVYLIVAILVLATACIVTVGFNKLCKGLMARNWPFYDSCDDYQTEGSMYPYDGLKFYDYLLTAESAAWLSFVFWLSLGGLTLFLHVCCRDKMAK